MVTGYQNEEITRPVLIPISDVIIGTFTEDYHLSEVQFERIKAGQPKTLGWALSLLGITIGFSVPVISKIIDQGDWSVVSSGDWKMFLGLAVLTIIFFALGLFLPNKRTIELQKIDDHFKSAEPKKQAVERVTT